MQRNQRNILPFSDIGGEPLFVHTRHDQVGILGERCQRRALVHPDLADPFHNLRQRPKRIAQLPPKKLAAVFNCAWESGP